MRWEAALKLVLLFGYVTSAASVVIPILHTLAGHDGNDKGGRGNKQGEDGRNRIPLRPDQALLLQFISAFTCMGLFWFIAFLLFGR